MQRIKSNLPKILTQSKINCEKFCSYTCWQNNHACKHENQTGPVSFSSFKAKIQKIKIVFVVETKNRKIVNRLTFQTRSTRPDLMHVYGVCRATPARCSGWSKESERGGDETAAVMGTTMPGRTGDAIVVTRFSARVVSFVPSPDTSGFSHSLRPILGWTIKWLLNTCKNW